MNIRSAALLFTCALLAACAEPGSQDGFLLQVPEGVVELAAPHQDVTAVTVLPEDGCYWYRHVGPVESTLLPLRTADGRPICARPPAT